tara:strand:- start:8082 stop:9719 length:1638 start_codon:yes stop_codon:yes gene_type:complete
LDTKTSEPNLQLDYDVVVVGAGFAGIYALWKAKKMGYKVKGFERASDVGGTWFWNSYPGARCDVESYNYAYFFDDSIVRDWEWSDACAGQEEIQRYLRFVADRCAVLEDISFNTKIESVQYVEAPGLWHLSYSNDKSLTCRYPILAIGALSEPKKPDIEGVADFVGDTYFTSNWPRDSLVDFNGKRVGVIGTGSSGVQAIPEIAKAASELYVFQRTANYVTPTRSGPMETELVLSIKKDPKAVRRAARESFGGHTPLAMGEERYLELDEEGRERALQKAWDGKYVPLAFRDAYLPEANDAISDFIRKKMLEQVDDPWTAKHLIPWDHPYGGKRPCMSNVYLQTYNFPHVHLIPLSESPIEQIDERGIKVSNQYIPLDVIVFATGFDAISGPLFAIDIRGLNGQSINEAWKDGPANYLGTMVNGFPNLFLPSSAMSPSVLSNMATLAEQQIDFILDSIDWLEKNGRPGMQPTKEAQNFWQQETLRYAKKRPGALTTKSWYSGANIPGKPRIFMVYCGGFKRYNETCYQELEDGFPSYELLTKALSR